MSRGALAERAAMHPRHVALGAVVGGLLLGHAPASLVLAAALATAVAGVAVPLASGPPTALALAAALLVAAALAGDRVTALERSALAGRSGSAVAGEATLLAALRDERSGGMRVLARFEGEPVLLRLPRWIGRMAAGTGDVVAVRGTLRAPDRLARTLRAHVVVQAQRVRVTGRRRGGVPGAVDAVRRRAERALSSGLPPAEAGLLRGMVLGEDDALPAEERDAFRTAGLTHLVAASGQNVMLLAALALGLCVVLGIGVRGRWVLVLALIALYVPLAGAGPSIQRAGIMGGATVAAALAGRPASRWYALLLAAAVTLAMDPRSATDAGWQLSFAAVLGIAALSAPTRERLLRRGVPPALAELVSVTVAATIATAPLIAQRFDRTSLVSLPANVLAGPAVAPVMWLGMIAAAIGQVAPGAAHPLVALAGLPLGYLITLGRAAAAAPGATVALPAAGVTAISALLAVALAAGPAAVHEKVAPGRRRRVGAVSVAVCIAVAGLALLASRGESLGSPPPGDLRVTALDIGQGDATLLQAGDHAVLVDAGPAGAPLIPELRGAGVRRLDALVLTHPQADHDGGAPAVLRAMPVRLLLDGRGGDRSPTSTAVDAPLRADGTRRVAAQAGQELHAGALTLRVLWPPATPGVPGEDPNDRAIVAVAAAYGRRALLTADAESPVLAPLDLPPVDVLKVSHHGSADPGLAALLQRLQPRVALIEVGRHNTYGHPAASTVATLRSVPQVLRTDRDGTVRVDLERRAVLVSREGRAGA